MLYLLIVFLLVLSGEATSSSAKKFNIFILAGQSNMAGRGGLFNNTGVPTWNGVIPPQCQPNPKVYRLSANLTWVRAHEPLHADIDSNKTNGVGPGMSFSNAVLTRDKSFGLVGLVPCAIGGTTISQWQKGNFLYKQLLKRVNAAVESGGVLRGLLWYQGESDTVNNEDADLYKQRLQQFFMDLRSDLQDPLLHIIQVALASGEGPYMDLVRKAQLEIDLLNIKTVDAKGLQLQPDGLHLSTASQVRLGEMMAHAFLKSFPNPIALSHTSTSHAPGSSSHFFGDFLIGLVLISIFFQFTNISLDSFVAPNAMAFE